MLYDGYISDIAAKFVRRFDEISAEYNFEFGNEYEIALCKTLRLILPGRFGICRGFVVARDGSKAGDDIIIYNRDRFSTLRLLDQDRFEQKENIPVEAVCAYIEAKHTLYLDSTSGGRQSFAKALKQVQAVKLLPRPRVPLGYVTPVLTLPNASRNLWGWPNALNPMYAAVWARYVKLGVSEVGGNEEIRQHLNAICAVNRLVEGFPDLLVAGPDVIGIPASGGQYQSPFIVRNQTAIGCSVREGLAYGVGVASLMYALDLIQLGSMPWTHLIADGLGVPVLGE